MDNESIVVHGDVVVSGAENGGAYADEGTALLHGYLIVATHSHGDFLEFRLVWEELVLELLLIVVKGVELLAYEDGVGCVGSHTHHAHNADMGHGFVFLGLEQLLRLGEVETELGLLCGDVELQQTVHHSVVLGGFLLDGTQQIE